MDQYGSDGYSEQSLVEEGFQAKSGETLDAGATIANDESLITALRTVYDPEIPVNIFDLGLIYKKEIANNGDVAIEMTLTAPGCPVAGELPGWVADAVAAVEGFGEVIVTLVWEPQWTPERMDEDAKLALGFG